MATEAVETISQCSWLDPKIIVPVVSVLIASVVIPLLLHWLKGRRERADKILELRTKTYTEYFKKYEQAAHQVGKDYEYFSRVTMKNEFEKFLKAGDSPEAIVAFQEVVGEFPNQIMSAHRKAMEELTTLKIIGSYKLQALTQEFETLNQQILEASTGWLEEMKASMSGGQIEFPAATELTAMGARAKTLKDAIIKQMRVEIGLDM